MDAMISVKQEQWPLSEPFNIAYWSKSAINVIVVEICRGAERGRGEAAPEVRYGESCEGAIEEIHAASAALARQPSRALLREQFAPSSARCALDCALWDLEAKLSGRRAWELAGVAAPSAVETDMTIGLGEIEEMAAKARAYSSFKHLKVKLSSDRPIERLEAVRAAAPNQILQVDVNEAWSFEELREYAPVLKKLNVALIEQPLHKDRDECLEGFASPIPIAADESCSDLASMRALVGRYQYVNIKLDKCGGLTEALDMARLAKASGLGLMVGSMLCTSLSIAPAMIVGALARFRDLDSHLLLAADRPDAIKCAAGVLETPSAMLWG